MILKTKYCRIKLCYEFRYIQNDRLESFRNLAEVSVQKKKKCMENLFTWLRTGSVISRLNFFFICNKNTSHCLKVVHKSGIKTPRTKSNQIKSSS